MARKGQVSIQDTIENDDDFENYIIAHQSQLICMEVFSEFCGPCLATANAIRKGKLEIGMDRIAMAKIAADNITALSRFKDKSEPVFLFIVVYGKHFLIRRQVLECSVDPKKGKLTRAMFGANGIDLCRIIEEELAHMQKEIDTGVERPKQEISHMLPEEAIYPN